MDQKRCTKCGETQPLDSFSRAGYYKGKPRLQSWCKPCANAAGLRDYRRHKDRYFAHAKQRDSDLDDMINHFKNVPCADCGSVYPPYIMDFDHRSSEEKLLKISTMRRKRMSFQTIIEEIKKCDVVCANCHRERTNKQNPARYTRKLE